MPSRLMQDRLEDSPPKRRQKAAVPPLCNAHLGSSSSKPAPSRGVRTPEPTKHQQGATQTDSSLLSTKRAAQPPLPTPLTQHSDAQHTPVLDNPIHLAALAAAIQLHDPPCLPRQDTVASSWPRRNIKRPERLGDSPTRGRLPSRPLQQKTPLRPKRTRRAPSRRSPSPQPTKRPRTAPTPLPHVSVLHRDEQMLLATLLSAEQQSGLPFDRGKT